MKNILSLFIGLLVSAVVFSQNSVFTKPVTSPHCEGDTINVKFYAVSSPVSNTYSYEVRINTSIINGTNQGTLIGTTSPDSLPTTQLKRFSSANPGIINVTIPTSYGTPNGTLVYICVTRDSVTTTELPNPNYTMMLYSALSNPIISGSNILCQGNSDTLTANCTGATQYSWAPATGLNVTTGQTVVASPTTTTIYTVYASNPANPCGSSSTTFTITVPTPNTPTITQNDTSFCQGGSVVLSASGSGPQYSWSNGSTTPSISALISGTYWVIGSSQGCSSDTSNQVQVTVNALPVISVSSSQDTICQGDQSILTASGGISYLWMPVNSTSNPITVSPTITTIYIVTGTNASGCTASATTTITVQNPIASFTSTPSLPSVAFTNTSTGATTYSWDFGDLSNSSQSNPSHTYLVNGVYNVCLIAYSSAGCSDTTCTTVSINTGMNELDNNTSLNLYPNPAFDNLQVELIGMDGQVVLNVVSLSGAVVISQEVNTADGKIQLNVSELSAGFYTLVINSKEGQSVKSKFSIVK